MMINAMSSMQGYKLALQLEIEEATRFVNEMTEEYDGADPDSIRTNFNGQAILLLKDIECLSGQKLMSGLDVSDGLEKLKNAFRSFLNICKPHVGEDEIQQHEIALLKIESPFVVEQLDPIFDMALKQMKEWVGRLDMALMDAERAPEMKEKRRIIYSIKNKASVFITHGHGLKSSLKYEACRKVFLQLEESFDRLTRYQNLLSGKEASRTFKEVFPDYFIDNKPTHLVRPPNDSISPFLQLVEVAEQSLRLPVESPSSSSSMEIEAEITPPLRHSADQTLTATSVVEVANQSLPSSRSSSSSSSAQQPTRSSARKRIPSSRLSKLSDEQQVSEAPSRSSGSSSSTQTEVAQQPTRSSARKRTTSSRLSEFSDEPQVTSPTAKKAKVMNRGKRMPFLSPESFGEAESLAKMINSLKPEGEGRKTNKVYMSSNKYSAFYEEFWDKKGWIEYYNKHLNTPENAKLKEKYEAYKKQNVEQRSESFRIRKYTPFGSMLFTTKTIHEGEIVGEYIGNVVPRTLQAGGNKYVFELDSEDTRIGQYVIDGEGMCNEMSLLAHNSEEYCTTEIVKYFDEDGPHILIIAKKEIPAGQAPSFNYGDEYWEGIGVKPLCLPH